jgi:hypothetical protein
MNYIFYGRTNADKLYAMCVVNGVHGLVVFPDNCKIPTHIPFTPAYKEFTTEVNNYNLNQWNELEAVGAIFFPVAGMRRGNVTSEVNQNGYYWSTDILLPEEGAREMWFGMKYVNYNPGISGAFSRHNGISVRLACDTIVPEEKLPQTLTSYSPCFRKEKGAHGIEERGVYRIHQFEKQEMIVVCKPEDSPYWFDQLWKNTVDLFRSLDIPVRTLECCSGDLADLKVKSIDVEAWSPRQQKYFEVGSCSNLSDAQARRLKIRAGGKDKKYFPHTLNNTVVAPPRMLIAFLENNLNASETSRKLFLHRNTLSYRLDKTEKETGLDVRKFSDAIAYRVISVLLKSKGKL